MRILVIANTIPFPPVSGGRVRLLNILQRVAKDHEVWLATHLQDGESDAGVEYLRDICQHVEAVQLYRQSPLAHLPGLARYALRGVPLELKFDHSDAMADRVRNLATKVQFDIVQIEESIMAPYLDALPSGYPARTVLTMYDVGFAQAERIASVTNGAVSTARTWLHARMMRAWEPRTVARFDRCVAVSEPDAALLASARPGLRVDVVPNGVDTAALQPMPAAQGRPTCLFVGSMSYAPCVDAVTYFCREVLPLVRARVPDVGMLIVGARPAPEVRALANDYVTVTGQVESVLPYYERCHVAVVPLRAGGGTRLKILEAMALGRPVVSTSIGCEGLDVRSGEHLLVADDPEATAASVLRLLSDPELCDGLVSRARALVESRYDWDVITETMLRIYADLGAMPAE